MLDKIAESLEGDITIEPDWLSEHVGVLHEERVRIDPEVWAQLAGFVERREAIRAETRGLYHGAPVARDAGVPHVPGWSGLKCALRQRDARNSRGGSCPGCPM